MVPCLVLIAALCFSGNDVRANVQNVGFGFAASVTAPHYTLNTGSTDVIDMHDFRKAPQACAEGRCIRYHKHCAPADKGETCAYRVVWPGIVPDGLITVTADSGDAMKAAEGEIALVFDRDGKTVKLPFAAMTVLASSEEPPPCPGTDFAACDPP
jgi:hypothetical protein